MQDRLVYTVSADASIGLEYCYYILSFRLLLSLVFISIIVLYTAYNGKIIFGSNHLCVLKSGM